MLSLFLAMLETAEDRQQFTKLYEQCHERMAQTAMNILKDLHDVEDAVQNAFLQIIRHFEKTYVIPCEEWPFWSISIVKNEALMILRKKQKTIQIEDWDAVVEEAAFVTDYEELLRLFRQLPETYRGALEMKLLLDYSNKEIAEHLGLTESAVHTRISRGRVLLREIAEREGFRA